MLEVIVIPLIIIFYTIMWFVLGFLAGKYINKE
jgi:hypothetical protein